MDYDPNPCVAGPQTHHSQPIQPHAILPPMLIRLHGHSFTVSEPFSEGQRLTLAQAQALNSLRARDIRRRAEDRVPRRGLSPEEQAQAQGLIAKLDLEHQFLPIGVSGPNGGRARGPRPQPATLYSQILGQVALEEARVQANRLGREMGEVELEALAHALKGVPGIQEEATRRAEAQQAVAREALEALIGGGGGDAL